jgi:geranylgeranyl diphosphate synthase type II
MTGNDRVLAARILAEVAARVERALGDRLDARRDVPPRLMAAMRHSLEAGGKRLRPALCLVAGDAVGADRHTLLDAACALEMLHTFSLIHDDLPALDDDDWRRGRPSCHVAFDEATAILAGDGLLADAFGCLAHVDAAPARVLQAIRELADATGSQGMVAGQQRDIDGTGQPVTQADVEAIHAGKTAALLGASVAIGAILGGGSAAQVDALRHYGHALGMAFQAVDDVLDATGSRESLGKSPGKDAARQVPSLARVLGIDGARRRADEWAVLAIDAVAPFADLPAGAVLRGLVDLAVHRDR